MQAGGRPLPHPGVSSASANSGSKKSVMTTEQVQRSVDRLAAPRKSLTLNAPVQQNSTTAKRNAPLKALPRSESKTLGMSTSAKESTSTDSNQKAKPVIPKLGAKLTPPNHPSASKTAAAQPTPADKVIGKATTAIAQGSKTVS